MSTKKYISGQIREFDRKAVEESREVTFIISSADKDRHRSVVNMDGWDLENFNLNPIVGYQHNVYGGNMCTPDDPDDVLGSGRAWVEQVGDKKYLMGSVKFETEDINPKAEKIFRKVLAGTLRATSVGFMEKGEGRWEKELDADGKEIDKTYYFKGQELLEFSIVNIPSNPKAVGRSLEVQKDWALMYIQRFLPKTLSLEEIENMSVRQVMELVNGKIRGEPERNGDDLPTVNSKSKFEKRVKELKTKLI